ncbi:phosphate ABC transporter ATP-binding protein [Pseudalkalibacillus decolorationis]|uniref:ABC transporter ATP-binding protein n=1 Tax=Pseudalkalibacillus decolorationis TaxID=163879 RepID=UPI0021490F9F|nr:phosphate ABC transporter ATP-binding protein [Pseudalkalibacillus decolorationis]
METNSILRCENGSTRILKQLCFSIPENRITTIIGPSGAGKSSLIMLLNRLENLDNGTIYYKGNNINDYPVTELRREIGMVFQSAYLFDGTVEDNLKYGPSLQNKWDSKNADKLLDLVDLPSSYKLRAVTTLSGGEQQRVALARTLANKPNVLLLDEATSALDVNTTKIIEQLLERIQQEDDITMVMVTHNLAQSMRIGDFSLYLQEGKLIESGVTKELLDNPSTKELKNFLNIKKA